MGGPVIIALLALQAAPLPDIQIGATVEARSMRIEKKGNAKLEVRADPDAGSVVKVEAPRADGVKTLRNVRVAVDAEARIGTPQAPAATTAPEPR